MQPSYAVYAFISYLLLALLIPLGLALVPIWRKSQVARPVTCPSSGKRASIGLDPWYAMKRHAFGEDEQRVRECSEWPACRGCSQECLVRIAAGA